jgi:hypothetical protein
VRRSVRVALGLVAALAVASCADTDDGGDGATESMVLETCAPGDVPVEEDVCRCAFDTLTDRLDADELERLDQQLRDDPETVPPDVQAAVLECGFAVVAPPTTKPPTPTSTSTPTSTTTTTTRPSSSSGS